MATERRGTLMKEQSSPDPLCFGPYQVVKKIGEGGMARVYKAEHRDTGQIVALKVAADLSTLNPTLERRFQREFELAKNLSHPSLIRAYAFGQSEDSLYQAIEFVSGRNLEERIRDDGPLPLAEAVRVFTEVTGALAYLHERGALHRDIKPSNIMLPDNGPAKLGDFGLLKSDAAGSELTRTRQSLGTIGYGAPEQFEDAKRADLRCDLYSLAATFYAAVTGELPFGSGGHLKVLRRKLLNQFVPLGQMASGVSPALDQLISRALNADPKQRPKSCAQFFAALREQERAPAAPRPVEAARPENRRRDSRCRVSVSASFEPMFAKGRNTRSATIVNLSQSGLCLRAAQAFDVGVVLQVDLRLPDRAESMSHLARVCWAHTIGPDACTIGCQFIHPLAETDFDGLLQEATPRTTVSPDPAAPDCT